MSTTTIKIGGSELSPAELAEISQADVVIGVNRDDGREFTLFGTPALESTISLKRPSAMRTVCLSVCTDEGGLERVIALVRRAKGRVDYEVAPP